MQCQLSDKAGVNDAPLDCPLIVLPFLAVLIKKGPCIEVLWALLLQLLGHIPGVVYGIYQVTRD